MWHIVYCDLGNMSDWGVIFRPVRSASHSGVWLQPFLPWRFALHFVGPQSPVVPQSTPKLSPITGKRVITPEVEEPQPKQVNKSGEKE